jgi:putative addiction module component (TIGR02574 family)
MSGVSLSDLLDLPIEERARLAQAIWDSIAEVPERVQLTESDRQELDRRLASYLENPEEGSPWSEVRSRILGRT